MVHCPSCGFNDDDEWQEVRDEIERLRGEVSATIERCAQVADAHGALRTAIAIRALKEKGHE